MHHPSRLGIDCQRNGTLKGILGHAPPENVEI